MKAIGSKGFASTVARHWGGDKASYLKHLHDRAHESMLEGFVDREMARRLDQGEQIVAMELPVLSEPDEEPW